MENQPTTLDKAVKISIIAGALIVALSIAYYVGVFLPKKEVTRIEEKKRTETKQLRDNCLARVEKDYLRKAEAQQELRKRGLEPFPTKNPNAEKEDMEKCLKL